MPAYRWDVGAKRYRDTDTGRFLSREKALEYVDGALQAGREATGTLANLVAEGTISAADWRDKMRQEIKDEYIRQYLSARGGLSQMTQSDWGSVGGMLTEQYKYLDKFYGEVAAGNLTEGQIAARAGMYVNSAREANERAHGRSQGMPDLDRYPGSGSTPCLTNCKCFLVINTTAEGWDVYWKLGDAEHCDGCVELAASWSPLKVKAGKSELPPVPVGSYEFPPFEDDRKADYDLIDTYNNKLPAWKQSMTDGEKKSIRLWIEGDWPGIRSRIASGELTDTDRNFISALKSAPVVDNVIWRGIRVGSGMPFSSIDEALTTYRRAAGTTVIWDAPSSTSLNPSTPEWFGNGIVFEIRSKSSRYISDEIAEAITLPGTRYTVVGVSDELVKVGSKKQWVIQLLEI